MTSATCSALLASVLSLSNAPAGASPVPRGVMEVTGYGKLSLDNGSQDPVRVEVKGRKAAAIRSALSDLSSATAPDCMENLNAFTVSVLPRLGARPIYVAHEESCPTPGRVDITTGNSSQQTYKKLDCALQDAVLAALPRGRAVATRHDASHCAG